MPDFPDNLILLTCLGVLAGHLDMLGRPIQALPAPAVERSHQSSAASFGVEVASVAASIEEMDDVL